MKQKFNEWRTKMKKFSLLFYPSCSFVVKKKKNPIKRKIDKYCNKNSYSKWSAIFITTHHLITFYKKKKIDKYHDKNSHTKFSLNSSSRSIHLPHDLFYNHLYKRSTNRDRKFSIDLPLPVISPIINSTTTNRNTVYLYNARIPSEIRISLSF